MNKTCTKCGNSKPLDDFYRMKSATDGRKSECKVCSNDRAKRYREENPDKAKTKPEYSRAYYLANADKIKAYQKRYNAENGEKVSARRARYQEANADKIKAYQESYKKLNKGRFRQAYYENHEANLARARRYREENPDKVRDSYARWLAKNPKQKVRNRIAVGLRKSVVGQKPCGVFCHLPYSYEDLIARLDRTMPDGYTWDDIDRLHIDHIRPVAAFDFCSVEDDEFQECWALSNLRLLPANENIAKKDSLEDFHDQVWSAICHVESGGNPNAHHQGEDARGIAQIRAIMVEDVNRIVGSEKYSHDDAWCPLKSREMFDAYNNHYHPNGSAERISRCWNGGPTGHKKKATLAYWNKVKTELERNR